VMVYLDCLIYDESCDSKIPVNQAVKRRGEEVQLDLVDI